MYKRSTKVNHLILLFMAVGFFSSCTTTFMTVSPRSYKSAMNDIDHNITSLEGGYQLSGSGSDTKNELVVKGQSYSKHSGYGTLMDNEVSIYDSYTYTDTVGNSIEFQIKRKNNFDYKKQEYIKNIEVVECNCGDKKLYSKICGEGGVVKNIERLKPDQQSKVYDAGKTYTTMIGISAGVALITLIPLLAL